MTTEVDQKRRSLLKTAAIGTAAAAVGAIPFIAKSKNKKTYQWSMVTSWPKNYPVLGTGAEKLAQRINEMSDNRLNIKVYGSGEIVPAFEALNAVSNGTAQMCHAAAYYWKGKIPSAPFFSGVPFGMTAPEMNAWLFYGGGLELYREVYAPLNVIPFVAGNTGLQMGGWYNRKITKVEDLKGLKIRMPGIGGDVMQRAGAVVVNIPGKELFNALKNGTIDATEWVGPYNDLAFGFHKAAQYYYHPGWHEPGTVVEACVNKQAYEALPKDLQNIISIACQAAYIDMRSEYLNFDAIAYKKILAMPNIEVLAFPDPVLRRLRELSADVVADLGKQSPELKKVYKSYSDFANLIEPYQKISTLEYLNARSKL